VARLAACALLDRAPLAPHAWPSWLAPHQIPAAERLTTILARHGGAVLADAPGLGKSYVALAVALARGAPFALVVPAVLAPQWRGLLHRFDADAPILTHESLSSRDASVGAQHAAPLHAVPPSARPPVRLFIVDEAHRFRNPDTRRYRALARLVVGARLLLVTATPVHNRIADLLHLLRLFLRDHALAALGVPSLRRAATGEAPEIGVAAARLIVARSRRVASFAFPQRVAAETLRVGAAPEDVVAALTAGVQRLSFGGPAAPLLRLLLLRRLASSLAAFRTSIDRHVAYLDLAARAAAEGRGLPPRVFQHCFPRAEAPDLQLVLFPVLLEPLPRDALPVAAADRRELARLRALAADARDPKADALERLLDTRPAKTIVFTDAQPTARYLLRRLSRQRAAAVFAESGRFAGGSERATRQEVLRAFAPIAQHAPRPAAALTTDLLIATDLVSEGLNLQDAERVVHYDLPWSPARLAQRVGRIDRLGSPHSTITVAAFLPPNVLTDALAIEQRLVAKAQAQTAAGAAHVETTRGEASGVPTLDWCDHLQRLAHHPDPAGGPGAWAAVQGKAASTVLVVRIGALTEAIVVEGGSARTDPVAVTAALVDAARGTPLSGRDDIVRRAIAVAAPLIRARLAAVQDARWRAGDRDRFARRLIPWVLSFARRAARRADATQLAKLDELVSRLALGMTAGEELLLEDLLERREPLRVRDLLGWHERLPPVQADDAGVGVELVAALVTVPPVLR
jgi:superfamily II DNA or RNA helicase